MLVQKIIQRPGGLSIQWIEQPDMGVAGARLFSAPFCDSCYNPDLIFTRQDKDSSR
jgi:hypothetical protein